jgi:hypothetical protein
MATPSSDLKSDKKLKTSPVVSRLAKAAREAAAAKNADEEASLKLSFENSDDDNPLSSIDKKRKTRTVVSRLAKAAREAAAKNAQEEASLKLSFENSDDEDNDTLSSITDLSRSIDEELLRPRDGYRPPRETSSMRSLLEHNDKIQDHPKDQKRKVADCRHVALVFSKPLLQDQITTEYASRLVSLARAMKHDDYKPTLVCFCGSTATTNNNLVAETSAGVIFFRHLCAANQISLDETDLSIIGHEDHDLTWSSSSLHPVVEELLQHRYLESWLVQSEAYESETDEYGLTRRQPRKKILIHWTLISTDYHLCNLNDIHERSPRRSPLNTLLLELRQAVKSYKGIAKTTWCFRYSTYPYLYSKDTTTAFLGKCYLMAQELRPLLTNLRGVAKQVRGFVPKIIQPCDIILSP